MVSHDQRAFFDTNEKAVAKAQGVEPENALYPPAMMLDLLGCKESALDWRNRDPILAVGLHSCELAPTSYSLGRASDVLLRALYEVARTLPVAARAAYIAARVSHIPARPPYEVAHHLLRACAYLLRTCAYLLRHKMAS
jgi:hypothetical protein